MSVVNSNGAILGAAAVSTSASLATTGSTVIESFTIFVLGIISILLAYIGFTSAKNKLQLVKAKRK